VQLVKLGQSEKGAFKLEVHSFSVNILDQTGCSMTSFKHKLDKYLESIPDKPRIPCYKIEMDTTSITSEEFPGKLSNTAEAITKLAGENTLKL